LIGARPIGRRPVRRENKVKVKVTDSIKERLLFGLGGVILGAAGGVGASILQDVYPPFEKDVLPAISKNSLVLLCLLLLMICLAGGAWLIALLWEDKATKLKKRYDFLPERAFYKEKKTGAFICSNCLLAGMESPLAKTYNQGQPIWRCTNKSCSLFYPRPANE
jgi:hypothetical protein